MQKIGNMTQNHNNKNNHGYICRDCHTRVHILLLQISAEGLNISDSSEWGQFKYSLNPLKE